MTTNISTFGDFCTYCGGKFPTGSKWPKACACGKIMYRNPVPVAVALVPVSPIPYMALLKMQGKDEPDPKIGVHLEHCCLKHGCKYGDDDCPVATSVFGQSYPCEDCEGPPANGIVVIKRGIQPKKGEWALPGGFVDHGESWEEACAREFREETGIILNPGDFRPFMTRITKDGNLLIFGMCKITISAFSLQGFKPNDEVEALATLTKQEELAFPLHTEATKYWFHGLIEQMTIGR